MSTIITVLNTPPSVAVSFTWAPVETFTYAPEGHTGFSAPGALVNTELTFTAVATVDSADGLPTIIQYDWDFGDGIHGHGRIVTHTYIVANLFATTILTVTDSMNRRWLARAPMYLTAPG